MFEIECKNPDEIILTTKKTSIKFNVADETIDANLDVGKNWEPAESGAIALAMERTPAVCFNPLGKPFWENSPRML